MPTPQLAELMANMIPTSPDSDTPLAGSYVVPPMSITLRLKLHLSPEIILDVPRVVADCVFETVSVSLQERQYHSALYLVEMLSNYSKAVQATRDKPAGRPSRKQGTAAAWWRFAIERTLADVRRRRGHGLRLRYSDVVVRLRAQRRYIELYKRSQGVKWHKALTKQEQAEMHELEDKLETDDIIFYRTVADAVMEKEAQNSKQREELTKAAAARAKQQSGGGWGSWFGYGKKLEVPQEPDSADAAAAPPAVELTPAQMDEIYKIVGYSQAVSSIQPPKEYVNIIANVSVNTMKFSLVGEDGNAIMEGTFEKAKVDVLLRTENIHLEMALKSFDVTDRHTPQTLFPKIVSTPAVTSTKGEDFLRVCFDLKPLNNPADTAISVAVNPLEFTITKPFIDRLAKYFTPRERLDFMGLSNLANDQMTQFMEQTRAQLEIAVEQHKTLDLSVKVAAPKVLIPQNPQSVRTPLLLLDLGTLCVRSDLSHLQNGAGGEEVKKYKQEDFYDKYMVDLTNVKLLIAVNDEQQTWRDPEIQKQKKLQVVEDFTVSVRLGVCIKSDELTLTQFLVGGTLPELKVNMSVDKYDVVMALLVMFAESATTSESAAQLAPAQEPSSAATPGADIMQQMREAGQLFQKEQLLLERRLVEVTFVAPLLQISVQAPDNSDLVRIRAHSFLVRMTQRTWDLTVKASLVRLSIDDCVAVAERGSACSFPLLATSAPLGEPEGQLPEKPMLAVTFTQTSPVSPQYHKVDTELNANINSFSLVCNPNTIATLLRVALSLKPPEFSKKPPVGPAPEAAAPPVEVPVSATDAAVIISKVNLSINAVTLALVDDNAKFAEFSVNGLGLQCDIRKDSTMVVQLAVSCIGVCDSRVTETGLRNIVAVQQTTQPVMRVTFATFGKAAKKDGVWDSSFSAEIKQINVVVVFTFFLHLMEYLLQGPILAPILKTELPSKATQSIAEGTKEATNSRVQIFAKIEAPEITLVSDESSSPSSPHAVVRLGCLTAKNSAPSADEEMFEVSLGGVFIGTALKSGEAALPLLHELGLELKFTRVVSNALPQKFAGEVVLPSCAAILAEQQVLFLLALYSSVMRFLDKMPKGPAAAEAAVPTVSLAQPQPNFGISVHVGVVSLALARNYGATPEDALAELSVREISVHLSSNNGDTDLKCCVGVATVKDTRAVTNLFPYLLSQTSGAEPQPLVSVTLKQTKGSLRPEVDGQPAHHPLEVVATEEDEGIKKQDSRDEIDQTVVVVNVNRPKLVVVAPFLVSVKEFAMALLPSVITATAPKPGKTVAPVSAPPMPPSGISARVQITAADVLAVSDPTVKSPLSLYLGSSCTVVYESQPTTGDEATVETSDTVVRVFSLKDAATVRTASSRDLIAPLTLKLRYVKAPLRLEAAEQERRFSQAVDVTLPVDVNMVFSYKDFKLLMWLVNATKPLSDWSTLPPKTEEKEMEMEKEAPNAPGPEQFTFRCPAVRVSLVNDFQGRSAPLIEVHTSQLEAVIADWSSAIRGCAGLYVAINFFDYERMTFEHVLDEWHFTCALDPAHKPNVKSYMLLTSEDPLNLYVSHGLLLTLATTFNTLAEDFLGTTAAPSESTTGVFAPLWIRNDTGEDITVAVSKERIAVPSGGRTPLRLQTEKRVGRELQTRYHSCAVFFTDGTSHCNVTLDRLGTECHPLDNEPDGSGNRRRRWLFSSCRWSEDGSKCLVVHSRVLLRNNTPHSFSVTARLEQEFDTAAGTATTPEAVIALPPQKEGESASVPLQFCDGTLYFTPQVEGTTYVPCKQLLPLTTLEKRLLRLSSKPSSSCPGEVLHYVAAVTADKAVAGLTGQPQYTVTLSAPLALMNILPVPIVFEIQGTPFNGTLESGQEITAYCDLSEKVTIFISSPPLFERTSFQVSGNAKLGEKFQVNISKDLALSVNVRLDGGTVELYVLAPVWLVNKSGVDLMVRSGGISLGGRSGEGLRCPADGAPIICCYDSVNLKSDGSEIWSKDYNVSAAGTSGLAEVMGEGGLVYNLTIAIHPGNGMFVHSRVVTITPYFMLRNQTDKPLCFRQYGSKLKTTLPPGQCAPFHFLVQEKGPAQWGVMQLRYAGHKKKNNWSPGFVVKAVADTTLQTRKDGEKCYTRVTVGSSEQGLEIEAGLQTSPPYIIENDTDCAITVNQGGCPLTYWIEPRAKLDYCWDEPGTNPRKIEVVAPFLKEKGKYSMDKVVTKNQIKSENYKGTLFVFVTFQGVSRVLCFTDKKDRFELETQYNKAPSECLMQISLKIPAIGLSLTNKQSVEMLYLTLHNIKAKFNQTPLQQMILFEIDRFQVDTYYGKSCYDVVMRSVREDVVKEGAIKPKPWFHVFVVKSTLSTVVMCFPLMELLLQPLDIQMDTYLLRGLMDLFGSLPTAQLSESIARVSQASSTLAVEQQPQAKVEAPPSASQKSLRSSFSASRAAAEFTAQAKMANLGSSQVMAQSQPLVAAQPTLVFFRLLKLSPIKIIITLALDPTLLAALPSNPVTVVIAPLGSTLANIDHAPLNLNTLELKNPFCSQERLTAIITQHYVKQLVAEAYKLVGSTEILGNPVGLFGNLGTGVTDFFYEPAQGLTTSPKAFVAGMAHGTGSLFKNTMYGTFNTVSKFTGALGKGAATLTCDDEYVRQRQRARVKQPKNVGEGTLQGVSALGSGVLHGVTGVVSKPMEGAQKEGVFGFAKGVGKGVIGLVAKPVAGTFDLVSKTTEGIRNTAAGDALPKGRAQKLQSTFGEKVEFSKHLMSKYKHEGSGRSFAASFAVAAAVASTGRSRSGATDAAAPAAVEATDSSDTDSYVDHFYVRDGDGAVLLTSQRTALFTMSPRLAISQRFEHANVLHADLLPDGGVWLQLREESTPVKIEVRVMSSCVLCLMCSNRTDTNCVTSASVQQLTHTHSLTVFHLSVTLALRFCCTTA
eukprot:TRINITY_DN3464_c0_g1_i3.p1 TRINITY_DN3464_c0_g1~~TRINITY_DN3464_c0_g1_i3.p1  ORF type:complete len:3177 (-),score=766.16 TRINITY_DN3464_c0_g1_i3:378-9125(-)